MKIIIYCKGKLFEKYKQQLPWEQIVAISDKITENNEIICNKPVIKPENIKTLQYDYIVVFSNDYFYEIVKELIYKHNVLPERIVSWKALLKKCIPINSNILKTLVNGLKHNNVLIREMEMFDKYVLNRESIGVPSDSLFETCSKYYKKKNSYKYDCVYSKNQIPINKKYDIVITSDYKNISSILKMKNWNKILLNTIYNMDDEIYYKIINDIGNLYYRVYIGINGWIWEIDNNRNKYSYENPDVSVYVVTHKAYPEIKNDECYVPICVGENYKNNQYIIETNGENISRLNGKINECTALYWIWKNSNEEIVGLNHYRRYFSRGIIKDRSDILLKYEICEIMNEYDMILPMDEGFDITVKEQLIETIPDKKIAEIGITLMRNALIDKQPEYINEFDDVMNSYNFYRCNMFIAKKNIIDRYCEWLFSFLLDVAEQIDVDRTDTYSNRIVGFLAERMLTVWLRKNPQKIKVVPYLMI